MSRLALPFALLLALVGASPQSAAAQTAPLPTCDAATIRRNIDAVMSSHEAPQLAGCLYSDVDPPLRSRGFDPRRKPDQLASGIAPDIVTHVGRDGNLVILTVSTGAGYSPPPPQEPVPQPTIVPPAPAPTVGDPGVTGGGKPAVSSFTIKADAVVMRGEAIGFTVTRSGPLPAVEIPYDIAQGSDVVAETAGKPHTLNFGEGVTSLPITIAPDNYTLCGDPLTVTLRTAPENPAAATAAFLGYMPDDCRRPPMSFWDRVQRSIDADPLWWGLGLLLVLTGVAASIWLLKRRPVRPDSPEVEDPSAPVSADCTIEPGTVALLDRDPQADRWPEIAAQVTIEPGSTLAPQPLPIREPTDE